VSTPLLPFYGSASSGGAGILVNPSGDPTGAADAAAINAAVAKLPATGGMVTLNPTAQWNILAGQVVINRSGVYINAPGTYIKAVGAGDVFRMFDSSNLLTRLIWGGGILGMPVIDGSATTGISCAFHAGDITQLAVFCQAINFTAGAYAAGASSKGVWLDNQWWWTEQAYGRVVARSCATWCQFDNSTLAANPNATGSFDRLSIDVFGDSQGVGDGVCWNNGALTINYYLGIWGNFKWASTATVYTALRVIGQNAAGASFLGAGGADGGKGLFVGLEVDGTATTQPTTITFSGSPFTFVNSSGNLYFAGFAQSNNSGGHFQCLGPVQGDPTLTGMQGLENPSITFALATGSTVQNQWYGFVRATLAASATGVIIAAGSFDGQPLTIRNTDAVHTITFAAAGASRVADGVLDVIAANTEATFHWDAAASLWYRSV
jgi:hypothetical protein